MASTSWILAWRLGRISAWRLETF